MRVPDWQRRLREWAGRRLGSPFVWGDTDCALVVVEAVDVIQGRESGIGNRESHASRFRGKYRSARQAAKFQRLHQIDLARWLEQAGVFRWPGAAQIGDLIVHPHPAGPWMVGHVVLLNGYCLTAAEELGVYFGRVADALKLPGAQVWRVV